MKSLPISPSGKSSRASGFTLVEILVALAVLGILILALAQIFGMMNSVWLYGQGKVNNFTKARAMLNILENDFHAAVLRPDLAAFPGGNCQFYTERPGIPDPGTGPLRNVSLVQYALTGVTTNPQTNSPTITLQRSDLPISWTDPASYLTFGSTTAFPIPAGGAETSTPRDTAPGVVAFQILFVQADGSFSKSVFNPEISISGAANTTMNGNPPTRGIGFTIVVIDDQAMRLLSSNQLSSLSQAFSQAVSGGKSVKADWEHYLATTMPWNTYPKNLSTGIGVYECYVPVP